MNKFFLRIVTPDSDFFSGEVEYLSIDTPQGREGFMRGALEKVAAIKSGYIEIVDGNDRKRFSCGDGIACVEKGAITVVTSYCCDYRLHRDQVIPSDGKREDYAKAMLVSSVAKLKNKNSSDEK